MWMNEWDVEDAYERYGPHPLLGPATATLYAMMREVNTCSDGWPYWRKPARAATRLMSLIYEHEERCRQYRNRPLGDPPRVDADELKKAMRPIKAFRTRHGLTFRVCEPDWKVA